MNKLQKMAFEILVQIHHGENEVGKINAPIAKLFGVDFPPSIALMPEGIRENIVSLIGEILEPDAGEHNIASYFLYEASSMKDGGKITLKDGREYVIKSLEDVEKFVRESQ